MKVRGHTRKIGGKTIKVKAHTRKGFKKSGHAPDGPRGAKSHKARRRRAKRGYD